MAKKIVDIGQGRGSVTLLQAEKFVVADLVRLSRMKHFMTFFKRLSEDCGAEIAGTYS